MNNKNNGVNIQLIKKISEANKKWGRKFLVTWGVFVVVFIFCDFFGESLESIGNIMSNNIPMINKLIKKETLLGRLSANYFSIISLLIPFFSLWVVCEDDVLSRCRYGNSRLGRGQIETFVIIYILGLPVLISLIYMAYAAPFDFPEVPTNFGQRVFHLMLNFKVGLLVLGSLAGVIVSQIFIAILWIIWLPVAYFFFNSKEG